MGKLAGSIILFLLCLNLASGLMITAGFQISQSYDGTQITSFNDTFAGNITGGAEVQASANVIDRVLDFITLGVYTKVQALLNTWLFGFSTILGQLIGSQYEPYRLYVNGMMTIAYGLFLYNLFTGKELTKE